METLFNNRRVILMTEKSQRRVTYQYVIDRYNLTQEKIDELVESGASIKVKGIEMWFDEPASNEDEWQ